MDDPYPLSLASLDADASPPARRNAPQRARLPQTRLRSDGQAARIPLASEAMASARSVRSQLNSDSVRPKCP
jgi:hypothetical protein